MPLTPPGHTPPGHTPPGHTPPGHDGPAGGAEAVGAEAVGAEEFAALMAPLGPFAPGRACAVAASGGADSTALALLAAGWGRPLALVVDHGLRPEAGTEAELAARRLDARGIPVRVLRLRGLERGPGLAERARAARYEALRAACREAGLVDLLLGHHARDQAETVLMRARAGSGPAGLAGMAALTHGEDVRLLRPLLVVPPARLRATLRRVGVAWTEDPSNRDPAALRTRLRQELDDPAGDGARAAALCRAAREAGEARARAEREVAAWLAEHAAIRPEGCAVLGPGRIAAPALAALVRAVSGRAYPPPPGAVAALAQAPRGGTLHGAVVLPHAGGWIVGREAAAMVPPVPARPGARWDGRFSVPLDAAPPDGASLGPLGADAARLRGWSDLPAAILRTVPCVRVGGVLFTAPPLGYPDARTCGSAPALFHPPEPAGGSGFVRA